MKTHHLFSFSHSPELLLEDLKLVQAEWTPHMNTSFYAGDWSGVSLRSPVSKNHPLSAGDPGCVLFENEPILDQLPYTKQVLGILQTELLSVRYLNLSAGSEIKKHRDADLIFWDGFVRLHLPIITNEMVTFQIDREIISMKAGELWFADFSLDHAVYNRGKTNRIHLVIDCKVNDWMRDLFIKEGIIDPNETKPDAIDQYPLSSKLQMIAALEQMGTETSKALATSYRIKYQLY